MIPKVAGWKKDRVSELTEIFSSDGVVAVVDVSGVPASNMIDMRNTLRDRMSITMAKKSLMRIAWSNAGRPQEEIDALLEGAHIPCVVHSNSMNAFEIFAELEKTRQGRAAKAGEAFPDDVTIPAGPTEFGPGPIVGEFNAVGIPAKIDKGKVAIQRETTFSKGDEISADLGIMLAKLGVNPIEIGLILTGAIEEGHIFQSSDLDLDTDGLRNDIVVGTSGAFNLMQHQVVLLHYNSNPHLKGLFRGTICCYGGRGVERCYCCFHTIPSACSCSVPSRTIRFLSS